TACRCSQASRYFFSSGRRHTRFSRDWSSDGCSSDLTGRPGPVLIDITKNAQIQSFDYPGYEVCNHIRSYRPKPIVRKEYIQQAAELINAAKKPFILFGQGVILGKAETEFKAFIEKAGIPAAATVMGLSALETDHPLHVGMLGMHGNYAPNVLTNDCDVLIAI